MSCLQVRLSVEQKQRGWGTHRVCLLQIQTQCKAGLQESHSTLEMHGSTQRTYYMGQHREHTISVNIDLSFSNTKSEKEECPMVSIWFFKERNKFSGILSKIGKVRDRRDLSVWA